MTVWNGSRKFTGLGDNMKLTPTQEQDLILAKAGEGQDLAISALSGTGKTSTLVMISKILRKSSLYVSYNKAISVEASTKFNPMWVDCKTLHSVAWQAIVRGSKYGEKLGGFIDRKDVIKVCPDLGSLTYSGKVQAIGRITDIISLFCSSDKMTLEEFLSESEVAETVKGRAALVWEAMVDEKNSMGITHDVYLKLFQMSKPKLPYKVIYLDEAQDISACTLDIVMRQRERGTQIILVGDTYQNIYSFNNTVNAFDLVDDSFCFLELSKSFRFPQHIADKGLKVLRQLGYTGELIGKGTTTEIKSKAILVRTNLDLFSYLAKFAAKGLKSYAVGDLSGLFKQLYSAQNLKYSGDKSKRTDKLVRSYDTWEQLVDDREFRPELSKLVAIIETFADLHETIVTIKSMLVDSELQGDTTLVTAHKAKGLEWDEVTLAKGFIHWTAMRDLLDGATTVKGVLNEDDTGRLLYMALTRGKVKVNIPEDVKYILENC